MEKGKIKCEKVRLDVETSWNSTYLMLETTVKYGNAFHRPREDDNTFVDYFFGSNEEDASNNTRKRERKDLLLGPPGLDDWETARYILKFINFLLYVVVLLDPRKKCSMSSSLLLKYMLRIGRSKF